MGMHLFASKKIISRNSRYGLTLVELMIFLGLMTSVLLLIMRIEIMGRQTASIQMAQYQILSTVSPALEEIGTLLKNARQINVHGQSECLLILKDGSQVKFFWNPQDQILYEQKIKEKEKEKEPAKPIAYFLKNVKFQISSSASSSLFVMQMEFSAGLYSLSLERKIALFEK